MDNLAVVFRLSTGRQYKDTNSNILLFIELYDSIRGYFDTASAETFPRYFHLSISGGNAASNLH